MPIFIPMPLALKAAASIGKFYDIPMDLDGTVDTLLRHGDQAGIDRFLVQSVAVTWERAHSINDFIARSVNEHPDRFVGFGAMHPDHPEMEKELDRILSLGLKGVKLHPDFQHFCLDDPNAVKLFEAMAERNLALLVHTGDKRYSYSQPERMARRWTACLACGPYARTWAAGPYGAMRGRFWPDGGTCGWIPLPACMPCHRRRL